MMGKSKIKYMPPKLARWVLKRIIDRDISYAARGDFYEIYAVKIKKSGTLNAAAWYWLQVIKSFPAFVRDSAQ